MPVWWRDYEAAVCILHATGSTHHPVLWILARELIAFHTHENGGRRKEFRDWYPMTAEDCAELHASAEHARALSAGATVLKPHRSRPANFKDVWRRAHEQLHSDIGSLLNAAALTADTYFFKRWGDACEAVAFHVFGAKHITGKRAWCNGEWLSDLRWDEGWQTPAAKRSPVSPLRVEICSARLHLMLGGQTPTHAAVADLIIEWRTLAGRMSRAERRDNLIRSIGTTSRRLGLSTFTLKSSPQAETE
jgi:hypothetical protein